MGKASYHIQPNERLAAVLENGSLQGFEFAGRVMAAPTQQDGVAMIMAALRAGTTNAWRAGFFERLLTR